MSSNGINFTGIASGIDTSSIVTQLIAIERQPVQALQLRKQQDTQRQSMLNDVSTALSSLRTASNALRDPTYWAGSPSGTSGDDASYSLTATSDAPNASYQVQVRQLATSDVWGQTASAGARQFSPTYGAAGTLAGSTTLLSGLTSASGTSLGLATGQQIQLSGTQGGSAVSAAAPFTVTDTSTLQDLRAWVATSVPGSTVTVETGGRLKIVSPPGTDQELTTLSLSTVGGTAPLFDGQFASSSSLASATGLGKVQANDTLHITAGTLNFDVAVTAGMTMKQVAAAINAANGGVNAGVTDGKLRLGGIATGASQTLAITSTGSTAGNLGLSRLVQASNAIVTVNGVDVQSESNTSTTILPGATISLKQSSTASSTATTDPIAVDPTDAQGRVQTFITAYNAVIDLINTDSNEQKVVNATTAADKMKGLLSNSSTLSTIKDSLQNAMAAAVGGLGVGKSLASDLGISTGAVADSGYNADALTGKLTFDTTKFQALFATNRDAVRDLFESGAAGSPAATNGLAQRVSDLVTSFTTSGGLMSAEIQGATDEMADLDDQIKQMNARVDAKEAQLKAQFTAMELAISQLQSSSAGLFASTTSSSSSSSNSTLGSGAGSTA